MNFGLLTFILFLMVRGAAQVAARRAAVLAKGAVRTGILFQRLFVHKSILQLLHFGYPVVFPGAKGPLQNLFIPAVLFITIAIKA